MFKIRGFTGEEIYRKILDYNIRLEKYTLNAVVVTIYPLNTKEDLLKLIEAINDLNNISN